MKTTLGSAAPPTRASPSTISTPDGDHGKKIAGYIFPLRQAHGGELGQQAEDCNRFFDNRVQGHKIKRGVFRQYRTDRAAAGVLAWLIIAVLIALKMKSSTRTMFINVVLFRKQGEPRVSFFS